MTGNLRPFIARYGLAAVSYSVASVSTTLFWESLFKYVPFALFFAAVSATAWFGGFWPGFLVALSGAVTTSYLMASPDNVALAAPFILLVVATFICYLAEHRSRSRSKLEEINVLLETERDRLEALLHQMPAGVIIAKALSGEVILANKKVDEILRHPAKTSRGLQHYLDYQGFHSDGRPYKPEEYPLTRSVMTGEEVSNEEIEYLCGDGVRRIINSDAGPIRDRKGKVVAGLVIFDDVTERKRLEQQLRQSQRMEAVGRLAGGIAHDFNNLLTVIVGQSEVMLEGFGPNDPLREPVQQIDASAQRAAELTKQLLAFSRKQVRQPKVLDLSAIVADLGKMLRRLIGEDVELITRLNSSLGRVKADPGQIEQIILNLAINARDAMPSGGRLTIETNNASLDDQYANQHTDVRPGPYVMLAVSDTGIGMDKETQSRIFEPFFTTKEQGKGTGLGLATVYGIVKQSEGHIWVYSEPGRGTTFKVYLPRVEAPAEIRPRSLDRSDTAIGSETVLVVEDDDAVRRLVRQVMSSAGYTVMECKDADQALSMSSSYSGTIHLMITDVIMPGASGRELAQKITALRTGIRVLFMSGYTDNAIVHHGVLDEDVAFIEKPFTPAKLLRKAREVLDV
jgi:two-component system, cell cycle sensor histidine kinase and response regulator CckA